jgi:hypothetical protein
LYGHLAFIVAGLLTTAPKPPTPPVLFEPNRGQIDRGVAFMARGRSTPASIAADGSLTITLPAGDGSPSRVSIVPLGATTPRLDAIERQTAVRNVLVGRDPSQWQRGLPLYGRVRATNLYPGIDAEYYGTDAHLEYDFVVAPGSKPSAIRLRIEGGSLRRDPDGSLVIGAAGGEVRQPRPVAYQIVDGQRRDVDVDYVVGESTIAFDVGHYDASQPLVIDPLLVTSTYTSAGTTLSPSTGGIAVADGIYVSGVFPRDSSGNESALDAYFAKYSIDGRTLLFDTIYGGSGSEFVAGIAVDGQGIVYMAGTTRSFDLPLAGNQIQSSLSGVPSGFLARFSADGSGVRQSTYIGSGGNDTVYALALGTDLYVAMSLSGPSPFFPTTPAGSGRGLYVARLDRDGTPLRLQFFGANLAFGAIAAGPDGTPYIGLNVNVPGLATAGAFQTTPGDSTCSGFSRGILIFVRCLDGFVAHYSADLSTKLWGTYLRETSPQPKHAYDDVRSLAVDASGNVLVFGTTLSTSFPVTAGAFEATCTPCNPPGDLTPIGVPFVGKLNASGSALVFSTYLNGSTSTTTAQPGQIAVDGLGTVFVTGVTWNTSFPAIGPALPNDATMTGVYYDAYLTAFRPDGTALYSSRLGGPYDDWGTSVAVSAYGTAAMSGYAGGLSSFPLQNPSRLAGPSYLSVVSVPRIYTVLDVPAVNGLTNASNITIRGWAVDTRATSDTGIDSVDITAYALGSGTPFPLGSAALGGTRSDVALALGSANFTASGFSATATLPPGQYTIAATAHSSVTGLAGAPATVVATVVSGTISKIQSPSAGTLPTTVLRLKGFAVDLDAPSGTGVDAVHVWAFPASGGAVFLGVANYGETRSELADMFGAQFTSAGFSLTASTLTPGTYTVAAYAHSTVTGTFSAVDTVTVTILASATELYFSTPTGPDVYPGFSVAGWAIDSAAPAGTGVDAIHVWAFPAGGGPAILLGTTTTFIARSDVAAARGSRFLMSGYNVKTANLPPGNYTVVTYAHSTVAQAFNAAEARALRVIAATGAVIQVTNIPDPARVNGFLTLTGYAFDPRAASGIGVDAIHVYVYPNWGSGAPPEVATVATLGLPSGPEFGSQFTSAGFSAFRQLREGPGTHLVVLFAHSTVDGSFTAVTRLVTVPVPQFLVTVEQPQPGQTVVGPFHIRGWAIDRADVDVTPDNAGVDRVHVYAYPVAGGAPIFVCGQATWTPGGFIDRPDVAAAFGARFLKSGFDCLVNNSSPTLASGTYDLAVFAMSSRTRQYSPPVMVRFTVQ